MKMLLKHESGLLKEVKIGFSWTTFFFGVWVPIMRGQWSEAALLFFAWAPTLGLIQFIMSFKINKRYCKKLLEMGYKPTSNDSQVLANKKYIAIA